MRYRFYREHKYVTYRLYEFERHIAQTDFNSHLQIVKLKDQLASLVELMQGHAAHEDQTLHELLKLKGSSLYKSIEADHFHHDKQFKTLAKNLDEILANENKPEQISLGYHFYLAYRLFVSENLRHLHQEETIIMPELQRHYSDDELRAVEFNTYGQMTPEELLDMVIILFPHFNADDRNNFLSDIKAAEPEKFAKVWHEIAPKLELKERQYFIEKLPC
jgi:hypothetical protein